MTTGLHFAVDVSFQGQGPQTPLPSPTTFCLTEQEYSHAVLVLDYWGGDVQTQSLTTGTPILVNFGRPPQMRTFYGYVNHAGRTSNQLSSSREGRNSISIFCIGASWPLKQRDVANYTGLTNTQIIQQIATQFGLGSHIVPFYGSTGAAKQQGGLSYWEWCVQLAQEIGYTFYCDGIQLVAKPRQTNPNDLSSLAIVYDYMNNPALLPIFNPVLGSNSPGGGQLRNRQVAGVDARTVQPFFVNVSGSNTPNVMGVVQETPPFTTIEQFTAQNTSQAMAKLQGVAQANQLYLTASAVGPGSPQVGPGQLIFVKNANGSQNGLWFVTGAEHHINQQTYAMSLDLGRDSIGQTATLRVNPQINLPEEAAALVNNTWMAAAA